MSATTKGVRQTDTPGDARTRTSPIGKASHELETPGGGSVTTDDGTGALVVRLPSWLTDDERRAIVDGVGQLIESRGKLGAMGYAESVAAEVQRVMQADGLDEGHVQLFLGCTRARAVGLWNGSKPFKLDELATVADALGVSLLSLAAPGVDEGGQR